ncbi:MAG: glycosyltransferase family 4 protein [Deltaproteobacteria bacterium]|nr:glycosyltransferase family 4 protein [Deltaproteobacteria bacterium]
MNVLMYGWEFPPHISGGLGVACFGLTQALGREGHKVTFVLPRMQKGVASAGHLRLLDAGDFAMETLEYRELERRHLLEHLSVEVIDSALRPYITEKLYLAAIERMERIERETAHSSRGYRLAVTGDYGPNLMAEVLRYSQVAGAVARRVPHDVIHTHDWLTVLAGLEAKRVSGKPLVVHVHALEFDRSGENVNQAVYDIERLGMEASDRVVAVSHYTKDMIVRRYGIHPDKIEVVHNAVTRAPRKVEDPEVDGRREKVVLFLGRITFQKGPDYFIEAAAKVLGVRKDVRFVMAGSGDMAPRMIERVGQLRLGKYIHFTGFLTGADVERMYLSSDIYVMPSVSEPFGISPLEAMRFDVPVIISKQSGVSEILRHALKVDFWDIDDMASKILALLDHSALRDELVAQGSRELESIQWEKAGQRLTEIYGRLAAQGDN